MFDGNGKIVYPTESAISANLNEGDVIELVDGATYWDGKAIPNWVFKSKLYCRGFRGGNKDNVIFSTLKTGAITGVVKRTSIKGFEGKIAATAPAEEFPYIVIITADVLNVRAAASDTSKITTQVKKNQAYTIVGRSGDWGKLKSGAGWINLNYTKKK